jgi:hypothetical protein
MLNIDGNNNITLTRGDTLTLTVALTKDGETYTPEEGDVIRFALSKGYMGEPGYEFKLDKTIPNDTLTFTLSATETALDYRSYNYDIQVTHEDGCVDTFISAKLTITGEVK